jgi:hypothetical protein
MDGQWTMAVGGEMANDVFNAGPLARAFMTNASDPAGLYQRNRKSQNGNMGCRN